MKYALFSLLLLSGCLFSNDKTALEDAKPPYLRYGLAGDSTAGGDRFLIVTSTFSQAYCNRDTLVSDQPQRMIQKYRLRGDTLDFWFMASPQDSSLETYDVYARSRGSASWTGHWRRLRSVMANPNHAEVPDYMRTDFERRDSAYQNESMVITEDSIHLSYERTPEIRIWDLISTLPKSITYRFYGQDRTIFTKTGGAQVVFQEDSKGSLNVTSSNPSDKPYVVYGVVTQCPVDVSVPKWYSDFFELPVDVDGLTKRSAGAFASKRTAE